ncbi:MAG: ABC transporter substrate-binding protein, partial [Candidatus Rokubacteria bacterium]|nr:ABC transporter substrate-binding protein [Candidatus Rokubacteria bacterium]
LTRPGGNVTGVTNVIPGPDVKQLELLKQVVPELTHVAVLWNPAASDKAGEWRRIQEAAPALGVELQSLEVRSSDKLESAFEAALRKGARALIVLWDPLTFSYARRIAELAAKSRLSAMYPDRWFVSEFSGGGFMAYGPNSEEMTQRVAAYVDRILKGAKPADLPVEQPTKFELVVNLKTAKALGLTIPQSVLSRANEVIE